MKVLVTGKQGQLARALAEWSAAAPKLQMVFLGRPELDLGDLGSVARAIVSTKPELVINAAAYTAVDQAEDEPELAFRINADAAGEAAAAARDIGAAIIQISTDYVFDGTAIGPYREEAATNPLNVYGRSKLAGEQRVREANPDHLIVRTAWLYSPWGRNFVTTMLRLAEERDEVRVVADQVGTPTSVLDLAEALIALAGKWDRGDRAGRGDTLHFAGAGSCSWAEFATEIFRLSRKAGGPSAQVCPIATTDFPTQARRPAQSALDSGRFAAEVGIAARDWRESLAPVVGRLVEVGN